MARSKTLLQICTEAMEDIGDFDIPTTIIGNTDPTAIQLKRAAIKTGRELASEVKWEALRTEYTFATVNGTSAYSLPTDYGQFAQITFWDRSNYWELLGPATAKQWQHLKSSTISAGVRSWFRVTGNYFNIYPTPTTANTVAYEYFSRYYCTTSGGTAKEDWSIDSDLCRIDAELFVLGVIFYFKKAKGLPFAEDKADYIRAIGTYQSNDTPKGRVQFGTVPLVTLGLGNIPETGFGS